MSIQGISISETEDYISDTDKSKSEEEGATIFILKALDVNLRARLADNAMSMIQGEDGSMQMKVNKGSRNLEAVRFGLFGWRGFKDKDKKEIPFVTEELEMFGKTYKVPTDETLGHLPSFLMNELGEHILIASSMTSDLQKKLETQLSQL